MKSSMITKGLLLGLALLLATAAFAANKGSLQVQEPFTVSGQKLPAGEYQVKWEGTGSDVQLSILKGRKVVATAPAHILELKDTASQDSSVIRKNDDGTRSLAEIRFGGKKFALAVGQESAKADTSNESTTK